MSESDITASTVAQHESVVESVVDSLVDESEPSAASDETNDDDEDSPKPVIKRPPPSIHDENAFPALASANSSASSTPVSWGPSMSTPATSAVSAASSKSAKGKPKVVQAAFNISNAVSLNVARPEFAKIVNDLKKSYSVSIESTLSSVTKDRSFIVTGKPTAVSKVRKELVRRLTKPVHIEFQIPAKTRSAVIGAGGKNLKPIIDSTSTKIDIEKFNHADHDEEDEKTIKVSIDGDVDGVEEAKQSILRIVDEETKHLTSKIAIPAKLAPFVEPINSTSEDLNIVTKPESIVLSGLRDLVLLKKAEINADLETLAVKIKTDVRVIPKKLHQFIDSSEILKKFKVVVELPSQESSDETVSFVGLPSNIQESVQFAKSSVSNFISSSLELAKAHGGNISHAKALTAYFEYSGFFKQVGDANNARITAPSYARLASPELKSATVEISATSDNANGAKQARKEIVDKVNTLQPSRVRIVSDISSLFAKRVVHATETAAKAANVFVVPLSVLSNHSTDDIILIAEKKEDEEFEPTKEELETRLNKVDEALNDIRTIQSDLKTTVLNVDAEKQQFIEGPNGTTLKSILESAEHSILDIKLHFDGEKEVSNKVFIHGAKAEVSRAEKEIESLLKDAENVKDIYSFESTISVPTSVLSKLIGKNGANLNQLREKYQAEFDVEKNPTGEKAEVKITGYKHNVKEAEQFIQSSSKKWADETTSTIIIPKKHRPSIIGSNGTNIKKLQTKYDTYINFVSNSDDVKIRGPSKGVKKTEQELKDLLDYVIENGYTKELQIPEKVVSRVIGRQGETINRIAVDSGIDIDVSSKKDGEFRTVNLTGSRKGLTEAEKMINAIVEEAQDTVTVELEVDPKYFRDIVGVKGSKKQEIVEKAGGSDLKDYRRLLQIPAQGSESNKLTSTGPKAVVDKIISQIKKIVEEKENTVTETLEIPKEKHRTIIGSAGSTRRQIQEEFKVHISIPKIEVHSTKVTITGSRIDVEKAKAKVQELVADDFKISIDVPASLHAAVSERGAFIRRVAVDNDVEIGHGDKSKKAHSLASKAPSIPKEAFGSDDEKTKFTIIESSDESTDDQVIPWQLKGSDENVAIVEKLIKEALAKYAKSNTKGFFWVANISLLGRVIGPQGSRLVNIKNKSGADLNVPRSTDKVNSVIFIRGTKDAVLAAEKLILAEIED